MPHTIMIVDEARISLVIFMLTSITSIKTKFSTHTYKPLRDNNSLLETD